MVSDVNIKILVAYHKPAPLFKSEVLIPIHIGRELSATPTHNEPLAHEWLQEHMIGDNIGDNISSKYHQYHELTALYWAWKNYNVLGNPDYIGFMHYGSLLSFTNEKIDVSDNLDDIVIKTQILNNHIINNKTCRYDLLTAEMASSESLYSPDSTTPSTVKSAPPYFLDVIQNIIERLYPQYINDLHTFIKIDNIEHSDIFIMKRELFFKYAQFIFDVLRECEKKTDSEQYHAFSLYCKYVKSFYLYRLNLYTNACKVYGANINEELLNRHSKNPQETAIYESSSSKKLCVFPAFNKNNIPVVLACDNNYAPYGATTINSIIQNSNPDNNYDIILFHTDISATNQEKIYSLARKKENISIRIIDITNTVEDFKDNLYIHNFYSFSTYYRIFIPSICSSYKKILYLDTDMVVCKDIASLYQLDVSDYLLAATPDLAVICQSNIGKKMPDRPLSYKEYFRDVLGIENINQYFQAGVLLLNVDAFRKENLFEKFISKFQTIKNPFYVDQDILNSICYGRVKFFNPVWNHITHIKNCNYFKGFIPEYLFQQFIHARQNPSIIHYTGPEKPWHNPHWILADQFWKYATSTPFFEILMYAILTNYESKHINSENWTIDLDTVVYSRFYEKKSRTHLLQKFLCKLPCKNWRKKLNGIISRRSRMLNKAKQLIDKYTNDYKASPAITEVEYINGSNLFDVQYYSSKYGIEAKYCITHYCEKGWEKGFNPNPIFNTREYAHLNNCSENPLLHYIVQGRQLGHYVCSTPRHEASEGDIETYWSSCPEIRSKQVVYTCITGNYDKLINHRYIHPEWSYVCFTDNDKLLEKKRIGVWEIRRLEKSDLNNILNNRYHKLLPYDIFSNKVERSLYIDANGNILTPYIFNKIQTSKLPILVPIHFSTACSYQETEWYKRHYPQYRTEADNLLRLLKQDEFPKLYGMTENNIIFRDHSDVEIQKVMRLWWSILKKFVPRDQLSFSYVLWKSGISPIDISIPNARIDLNNFVFYPHSTHK